MKGMAPVLPSVKENQLGAQILNHPGELVFVLRQMIGR